MSRETHGSTALRERSLAPDLGRGLMLLLIAVAHAPAFAGATPAPLDHGAQFVKALLADNLARTLFVFLFGYGLGQLAYRQQGDGVDWPDTRKQLRRRGWWLIMIGFLHTVILVPLDIIAYYGVALVLLVPLVRSRDLVLLRTAAITLVPMGALLAWQTAQSYQAIVAGGPVGMTGYLEPDLLSHLLANLPTWPVETVLGTVAVVPGMLVGLWAARRRLLDEPGRHLPLLRRVAVIGLIMAVAGRLPGALITGGLWAPTASPAIWGAAVAHDLTGFAGGLALAAAIGLLAHAIGSARGRLITAVVALGQRSLTFYLFQSLVWLVLFYPFTLGLAGRVGAAATIMIAVAVWLLSVGLAELMRRAGHRGPLELVLRRLVAGRTGVRGSAGDRPTVASRSS
ncbi:DUF418 domain-containing protein [Microlunatus sp. GCM10028923]|uniref:DUF418 domain-containing protein n=1 Tax=Microlunatus sp. GCM10028923 TaxID=3273400 RepID=UPI00362053A3